MTLHALPHPDTNAWQDDAACLGLDPNTMQPEVADRADVERAKRVCGGCDVRARCLELAKSQAFPYGVHGGRWFGPAPMAPDAPACEWCGEDMPARSRAEGRGNSLPRRYCDPTCRKRAERARTLAAV